MQEILKSQFKNLDLCGCLKMIDFDCQELDVSCKVTKYYHFIGTHDKVAYSLWSVTLCRTDEIALYLLEKLKIF
jgi:hypothetical protein